MRKYYNNGYMISIPLPVESKYSKDYMIECTYRFIKAKEKYQVNMWLRRKNIHTTFRIDRVGIDSQFLSGEKETIRDNLCKVVENAACNGFFDTYIKQFEQIYKYIGACTDNQEESRDAIN